MSLCYLVMASRYGPEKNQGVPWIPWSDVSWHNRLMRVRRCSCIMLLVALLLAVAGCAGGPPDRRSQVDRLAEQVRALPGVLGANSTFNDTAALGPSYFELDVNVADNITAGQLAAITHVYLDNVGANNYIDYRAEMDVRSPG